MITTPVIFQRQFKATVKFSIIVYAAPASSQAASTALQFVKTLLHEGHDIYRLFFFSDGVHNTNRLVVAPQDEMNLPREWHRLISNYEIDSVACVSSAIKRGILNEQEAKRHELDSSTLLDSSEIAGLGQMVDAMVNSDRIVHFG
jgi:tRNA 2-thiouridine synthesizing protein D